jgi:hypothetical protein
MRDSITYANDDLSGRWNAVLCWEADPADGASELLRQYALVRRSLGPMTKTTSTIVGSNFNCSPGSVT